MNLTLSANRRLPWAVPVLDALLTLVCLVLLAAIVGNGLWGLGVQDRLNVGLFVIGLVLVRTALSADPVPAPWQRPLAWFSTLAQARARTMLAIGTTAFVVLHATRAWMRHASFGSNAYDLGGIVSRRYGQRFPDGRLSLGPQKRGCAPILHGKLKLQTDGKHVLALR